MPDNEPIQWSQLTQNQRNALVAQHVFGRKVVKWHPERDMLMRRVDAEGHENIPNYTESMDEAWKIVELFDEIIISKHIPGKYHCELWCSTTRYMYVAKTPQDAICIAALRAQGLIIEIEEKQ